MQTNIISANNPTSKRIGSYLVEAGLITQAHIDVVLADQEATGMRFGEIVVLRGWLKEQTIEYLMEKIVLPEREVNATRSSVVPKIKQNITSKESLANKQTFSFDTTFWENDSWVD